MELARQPSDMPDWNAASPADLIDYILARYHEVHRRQLPELIRLSLKVEQVHADSPDCPTGLAEHLRHEPGAGEPHAEGRAGAVPAAGARPWRDGAMPITVMRMEHDDHGVALERLLALTNNITLPRAACNTWRALYLGLRAFKDLMAHIHMENNILFENAMAPAARSASVSTPAGGCCAGAS